MSVSGRSLRNRLWELRPQVELAPGSVPAGVLPQIASMVASRGVGDLSAFFAPSFKASMPDPSIFTDMDAAILRVAGAIERAENIGIVGDYDVDGATSTALLFRLLRELGISSVSWRIPHRIDDGYGPNEAMIAELKQSANIDLLIIVDSGTAAHGPIARARELGIDVIVIDHHEPQNDLPDALIVNPKRDATRAFDYLCSVGLCFLFATGLMRELRRRGRFEGKTELDTRKYLGLVALGTVADVVPLIDLNRAFVALGLKYMTEIRGLCALMEATGELTPSTQACGFVYGPCLNAAGRIDDMSIGVDLLTTEDGATALRLADELHKLNEDRRRIQVVAIEAAKETVMRSGSNAAGIVLYDETWHPGVVGLVAAKVREAFDRPTIIIGAGGKGSARTVEGFDIGSVVIDAAASGILIKGGGHQMAAGLTVAPDRVGDLRAFLESRMAGFVPPPLSVDMVVQPGELSPAIVRSFERLAPFGQGAARPRLAIVGGTVVSVRVLKGLHVKATLRSSLGTTDVMAFSSIDTPIGDLLRSSEGSELDVYGTAEVSTYNGLESVIIKPEDLLVPHASASQASAHASEAA